MLIDVGSDCSYVINGAVYLPRDVSNFAKYAFQIESFARGSCPDLGSMSSGSTFSKSKPSLATTFRTALLKVAKSREILPSSSLTDCYVSGSLDRYLGERIISPRLLGDMTSALMRVRKVYNCP